MSVSADLREPPYPLDTLARGWRFEIDMETFKRSDTWKKARSGALRGALLLLWAEAWQEKPCGTLPDDDELIALMVDMPSAAFEKNRSVLLRGWWKAADGRLYHDTITTRVLAMLDKRANDAQRAANRRARNADSSASHAKVTRDAPVTHTEVGPEFDTKHQAPSTSTEAIASVASAKPPRASRKCPASFDPPNAQAWIDEHCPGLDWQRETEKFRDYTFKTALTDWLGAWRNWMRKALEFAPRSQQAGAMSFRERDAAAAAARVHEMTGGLVSAKPVQLRRADQLQEVFDATPRLVG